MSTTYSTSLKLTLIGNGDQAGIWGQTTNNNLGTLLEQAITGVQSITMSDANYTLTDFNGVLNEARNAVLVVGGANNAQRDLIPPLVKKLYTIVNNTTGGFAIRVIGVSGTGVLVPNGATVLVYCDGTNFVNGLSGTSGSFTINGAVVSSGNSTALNYSTAGNVTATGNVTGTNLIGAGAAISAINASNISSGTIANARTTAASANGASTIVTRDANGSFAGNVISATTISATTGSFTSISGDGSAISAINASNISSGTIANARTTGSASNGASTIVLRDSNGSFAGNVIVGTTISGTTVSGTTGSFTNIFGNGVALTAINASNITSGTVATARLASGTANSATFLRGDQVWASAPTPVALNTGNFQIQEVGGVLVFQYGGANIAVMDSGGNLTSSGQFQAGGSV